jgi:ABC-2 type transport system ATP-binding protein
MHRPIRGYSKGMRQRIKVAQALAHRPKLLILDEPFTGADPVARHELADLLRRLAAGGADILISSHVLHEVEALTRQIVMIDRGRIVAEGDVRNVRRRMHNRPHAIRVRVDQPRRLAVLLAGMDSVMGMKMQDGDTLIIETTDTVTVYDRLADILLDEGMTAWEIAAADESLEAVFGYLTDRSA